MERLYRPMDEVAQDEKNRENRLRKRARVRGYLMKKSRASISLNNRGQYMLVDAHRNWIVLGERYDATLDDIEEFLADKPLNDF